MKAVAKKPHQDSTHKKRPATVYSPLTNAHSINNSHQTSIIQLKPICPCDGGCPRCAPIIQPKLIIGQPNDKYEQEADRVADEVMRMPEPEVQPKPTLPLLSQGPSCGDEDMEGELIQTRPVAEEISPLVQRQPEEEEEEPIEALEEEEEPIMTKAISNRTQRANDSLHIRLNRSRGGGQPLPKTDRDFMETRFGVDFSNIRVHTNSNTIQMSRELNAQAFTHGRDIYFGPGKYSPGTSSGKRLLAHELTHAIHQTVGVAQKGERATLIQRTIGDGHHDLHNPRFSGEPKLEAAFDNEIVIAVGSCGDHVRRIQEALLDLGFKLPKYGADEEFGSETQRAVADFQSQHDAVPDGAVGLITMGLLDLLTPTATPIFKPPKGVGPPGASMSGKFKFDPTARFFPQPHLETGIEFPTWVLGFSDTKGWAFYVQNIMKRVDTVRITRSDQSKTCTAKILTQVLDSGYPYSPYAYLRFTGEPLFKKIKTSDIPRTVGPEEDFEVDDVMTLSTTQSYRMFIVWDPSIKESLPTRNEAHPISLGFVDWGWDASARFQRVSDLDPEAWRLQEDSFGGENRGGGLFVSTPAGARVEIRRISTEDQIDEELKKSCASKKLKSEREGSGLNGLLPESDF
jgi:peptidoglycan hydrolase-like protein with peptidoglycan-binding domain